MKPGRITFLMVILLILACSSGWGVGWKIAVGLAACFDLFLIGTEIKRILR